MFARCYWLSYFLDCFDGAAARKFNQATRFGQMLDMVCVCVCARARVRAPSPSPLDMVCALPLPLTVVSSFGASYAPTLNNV